VIRLPSMDEKEIDYAINLARNALSNHIQDHKDQMVTVAEIIAGFSEKTALVKKIACAVTIYDSTGKLLGQCSTLDSPYPLYKNIIKATVDAGKNATMSQVSSLTFLIDIISEKKRVRTITEIDEAIDGLLISTTNKSESRLFLPGNQYKSRASLLITPYTRLEKLTLKRIKG